MRVMRGRARFVVGNVRRRGAEYRGPVLDDLDEVLQKSVVEVLHEVAGLDEDVCNFIDNTAIELENSEYCAWLDGIQDVLRVRAT